MIQQYLYHRSYISSDNLHWVEKVVVGKHFFLVQWRIWFLGALKIISSWAFPSKIPRGLPVFQNNWNIKTDIYIYCCWVCLAWNVLWYNFSIQNRISEKALCKVFAKYQKLKKSITAALWILGDLEFVNICICIDR